MAHRRTGIAGVLLLAGLMVAGCTFTSESPPTSTPPSEAGSVVVEVGDNTFTPNAVEVVVDETVVWDFDAARRPHDVTFLEDPDRASGTLHDDTWSTSFDEPGTYPYECTLHSGMAGQVIVTS